MSPMFRVLATIVGGCLTAANVSAQESAGAPATLEEVVVTGRFQNL